MRALALTFLGITKRNQWQLLLLKEISFYVLNFKNLFVCFISGAFPYRSCFGHKGPCYTGYYGDSLTNETQSKPARHEQPRKDGRKMAKAMRPTFPVPRVLSATLAAAICVMKVSVARASLLAFHPELAIPSQPPYLLTRSHYPTFTIFLVLKRKP